MDTKIFTPDQIQAAAAELKKGNLVSFPTETVYGLGADATNVSAVKKVYKAKGRPSDNPLIVHVADVETVEKYAQPLDENVKKLMKTFWPGPLTIILKLKPGALAKEVTGGLDTAAFRNPNKQSTLNLIQAAGVPLVGPSANTSGKPSPTLAKHVYHDLNGKIAGILDDGATDFGVESTVIDMSTDKPAILRPGAVTVDQIERVIGPVDDAVHHVSADQVPKAPGMKYRHYAPDAQVQVVDHKDDWKRAADWIKGQDETVGVMATDDVIDSINWPQNAELYSLGKDVSTASHLLFAGLRHFDLENGVDNILTQGFPATELGEAYMNRLNKSAGQKHFE
ncbi:L-threonylcarbamoyladenylate synthase [Fructilactobacillus fructivorans]|uniref:Threonylcarbamoyl-AMP synthase n=1 Tax=Fructilactobacillus fructivorans TaxID=1614 RepID=A0A0C1PLI2_9LACO|nr:L-threonylcarbamoyladenylate synthase [Fructilactobacillus fructivorans]KID41602.1 YrdC/Sua5 family protein, required for threonylcarbamoyladenosine (t(6)A) formation in tRNA [Fructilactobacillus fructivorans]MCT0151254.1 threonylcarbamoyl-AMP synthase [Fructilactobacillus fructivorans]MCT2867669.1 threonylcarbamoyl-AMP synthase [Fructilactobacillus fructivorans]MCT2868813.1 threonylcarbamoyl-AMP synthase [Fructilactobacillus fructivorans]MCT2874017.1 threonylcarbamoyl-AMP synthase [Fructil